MAYQNQSTQNTKIRYSLTTQAWAVLTIAAVLLGLILAYIFVPFLSGLKDRNNIESNAPNYQIPISETPDLPNRNHSR